MRIAKQMPAVYGYGAFIFLFFSYVVMSVLFPLFGSCLFESRALSKGSRADTTYINVKIMKKKRPDQLKPQERGFVLAM